MRAGCPRSGVGELSCGIVGDVAGGGRGFSVVVFVCSGGSLECWYASVMSSVTFACCVGDHRLGAMSAMVMICCTKSESVCHVCS